MTRLQLLARGVSVALLLGCVASAVAIAGAGLGLGGGAGRPATAPSSPSNEKVQVAIASGRLLFVGASYTVGLGATTPRAGYAPVLANSIDRRFTVSAVSGTGFLNPGLHHQGTFAQRIAKLQPNVDPRIVVIQGGRNDIAYPTTELQAAARATITLARHRFPRAQVVVMGPIPAVVPVSPRLLHVRDVVHAAANQTGAGFVDPIAQQWITRGNEERYAGPVPFHPNDAGYSYIASRLLSDLPHALDQSLPPLAKAPAVPTPPKPAGATPTPTPVATGDD